MNLDVYLRESGIDAVAFAERVGLTPASISRIRRGEQNISRETIRAIVMASGGKVTAEALVFPETPPSRESDDPCHAGASAGVDGGAPSGRPPVSSGHEGGVTLPGGAGVLRPVPLHHPVDGPPPRAGEDLSPVVHAVHPDSGEARDHGV